MLQTTNDDALSTQATEDKTDEAASTGVGDAGSNDIGDRVGRSIENLSTIVNLAKKSKSIKSKKSGLPNAKANSGTDFLILGAKKVFIHPQKAFIKVLIIKHFDLKHHI